MFCAAIGANPDGCVVGIGMNPEDADGKLCLGPRAPGYAEPGLFGVS